MKQTLDPHAIAREIKTVQDAGRQIEPLTSQRRDFDVASAYEVARLVHQARLHEGSVSLGRKIGFTNATLWDEYGVREPIWSYVYDTTVVRLPGNYAACDLRRFAEPKIEPEIVIHFQSAPAEGDDLPAILECVDWIAHGIEIVQSHFPGWKFQAADTVADSALHGTLLVGEPVPLANMEGDLLKVLEDFSVTLSCNGEVKEVGRGTNVLGSPLAAIAHLNSVLATQPKAISLQANELVTTGTLTSALSIQAGETWTTAFEGIPLPGISVQFVA